MPALALLIVALPCLVRALVSTAGDSLPFFILTRHLWTVWGRSGFSTIQFLLLAKPAKPEVSHNASSPRFLDGLSADSVYINPL
jgi:hypothetical protein